MDFILAIFSIIILVFSVVIHELAHGSVAYSLGDPTAKYQGRLTLNPLKYLDAFGSVILPGLMLLLTGGQGPVFGWAKPMPVNPYNLRGKWGQLKVALAGPATNLAIGLLFGLLIRFLPLSYNAPFIQFLSYVALCNFMLALFNLIPIASLDGSWILSSILPARFEAVKVFLQNYGFYILILVIFSGVLDWLEVAVRLLFSLVTGLG